jgi:hypothetical protein
VREFRGKIKQILIDRVTIWRIMRLSVAIRAECNAVVNPIADIGSENVMNVKKSRVIPSRTADCPFADSSGSPQHLSPNPLITFHRRALGYHPGGSITS